MAQGLVADDRIFKITGTFNYQLQTIQTQFHIRDVAPAGKSAQDAVDYARPFFEVNMRTILNTACQIVRVDAFELTSRDYAQHEPANLAGTGNVPQAPSFMASLVSLRSSQRARHRNGRMFWPMQNNNAVNGSLVQDSYVVDATPVLTAFTDLFLQGPLLAEFKAVIVAQARPATTKRPLIEHSWIDVESIRMSKLITVQRRRKVGVGS